MMIQDCVGEMPISAAQSLRTRPYFLSSVDNCALVPHGFPSGMVFTAVTRAP